MQRKRLAVITARADDMEQKEILSGIAEAAFHADADVMVYSNLYNHWVEDEQLNFENIIYSLFQPQGFDGAIITAEAFMDISILDDIIHKLRKAKLPTVMIGGEQKGFESVLSDDAADMEVITDHLLSHHGFRNIDFLTGPIGNPVSHLRISGCKKAFEKHQIPFDNSKVHYGDFWNDSGEALAMRYLSGALPFPQAIICTNDYMAYGLCDKLTAAGISIPETLTITGYDYIGGRIYHHPTLTSYRRDRKKLGILAVNKLLGTDYFIDTGDRFVSGNTCSCGTNQSQLADEMNAERIGQYHTIMSSVAQFSGHLTLCRTLAEYTTVLKNFFYLLHGATALYLCLDKAWNNSSYEGNELICYEIKEKINNILPERFHKSILFPALSKERTHPEIFYFSPIHFQTRLFGYTVLSYDYPTGYDFSFRDFNKTVTNTLEFLRMKNDISYLKQCQRASSLYDSLTGFYNLREFKQIVEATKENCFLQAVKLCFSLDGEFLYGENFRNDVIALIAKTIKHTYTEHEIFCRANETTFLILCKAEKKNFMEKLKVLLHHAIYENYKEAQVILNYACLDEVLSENSVELLCRNIELQAEKHRELLEKKKQQPHYADLSHLRTTLMAAPHKALSLSEASRKLCISEGYFRSIYKQYFDISYNQDCINAKLLKACYLLCATSMSIYAISVNCGYHDEKFFARQFKQNIGCSPMKYRKKMG